MLSVYHDKSRDKVDVQGFVFLSHVSNSKNENGNGRPLKVEPLT